MQTQNRLFPTSAAIASILALLGAPASAGVNVLSATLTAHFDAGDLNNDGGVTDPGNGGTVAAWSNRVTGTTLTRDADGGNPIFVAAGNGGINNLATVRLTDESSGGDILYNNSMNVTAQTVFAVVTMNDSGQILSTLLSDLNHDPNIRQDVTNTPAYFAGNYADFVEDGTTGTFFINGTTGRAVTFGHAHILEVVRKTPTTFSGLRIGDNVVNPGRRWDGDVAEILIYDRALSKTDRNQVGNFLAGKYNISTAYVQATQFSGGDLLAPDNWSKGLPVSPNFGTAALDGTFDGGSTGTADWDLMMSDGTITAGPDWFFTGASQITIGGGILDVAGDILAEDDSVLTFSGGEVSWRGELGTGTSYNSRITISGGTLNGTENGDTTFGNQTGSGVIAISGGTVSASVFAFSNTWTLSTLGGSAVLNGGSATFGALDIAKDWSGSFTVTSFSGSDWEDQFDAGDITLAGVDLDANVFAANFTVSNGGQTLTYTPTTEFLGGDISTASNWSNGLPGGRSVGTIASDGTFTSNYPSFGDGTTVNMTAGALTTINNNGFNTYGGGIWNISGGRIVAYNFLVNSGGWLSVVNLSGGTIEVTGGGNDNNYIAVANGGVLNISGSAMLDVTHASVKLPTAGNFNGTINIKSDWSGTWIYGTHSGDDWKDLFLAGTIKLDGKVLDAAGFAANFKVSNSGQTLARGTGGTPSQEPPTLVAQGFDGSGHFVINAANLDPFKTYDLKRGTDLITFPDFVGLPTDGGATFQFIDNNPPAGKAFYRLEEQ